MSDLNSFASKAQERTDCERTEILITASAATAGAAAAATPTPAVSAAPSPTSASTATATSAAFARRTRLVYDHASAHEVVAIESLNGAAGIVVAIDFNEAKPARLTRKAVAHQSDIRR
jgi:hypothetical protein